MTDRLSAPWVAGIDGCRGRWLVVRRRLGGPGTAVAGPDLVAELVDDLALLIGELRSGALAAAAVDMPIGLLDTHPRACDVEARRVLGPRRSSVFPAPVRAVLTATDYDEARLRSRAATGVAPSRQAWNLVPAIRQLDALVEPADQDRLVEAHPELAFARLAGDPLPHSKRRPEGRALRRRLLSRHDPRFEALAAAGGFPAIDLLDAAVLTVTAERVMAGTERRLGGGRDAEGRLVEVVW